MENRYTIENFDIEESSALFDNETQQIILTLVDYNYEEVCELQGLLNKFDKDINWYRMWHQRFQRQIKEMQEELETFRPTKLTGNGQCSCYQCKIENGFSCNWTSWCYSFKGHIYCVKCLKKLFPEDYKNAVLEKKY